MKKTPINVLLIEDNPGDSRLIKEYILEANDELFKIDSFTQLHEGINFFESNPIDIVLLDLDLPDSCGIETFYRFHRKEHVTPIIILTGQDDLEIARKAVNDGAQDFLFKNQLNPISLNRSITFSIARKKTDEGIKKMAYHDSLTGLPNRRLFLDRLQMEISRSLRNNKKTAILLLDLDKFKLVNDTMGHDVGDLLLQSVGNRLTDAIRHSDTVARIGGDEFVIILPEIGDVNNAINVATKILNKLQDKYILNGNELNISASIGIALFPDDGVKEEELIKAADIALFRSKEEGRNRCNWIGINSNRSIEVSN